MPILLVVLGIVIVVFLIRVIVGFISAPIATLARLLGWSLNLIGLLAAVFTVVGILDGLGGDPEILTIVVAGLISVAAFTASAFLARARRRAEIRRVYADQLAVERQLERRDRD